MSHEPLYPLKMKPSDVAKDFRATAKKIASSAKGNPDLAKVVKKIRNLARAVETRKKHKKHRIAAAERALKKTGREILSTSAVGDITGYLSKDQTVWDINLVLGTAKQFRKSLNLDRLREPQTQKTGFGKKALRRTTAEPSFRP